MKPQRITISIGELVLDGFAPCDHALVGAALSSELERLFAERGVPPGLAAGAARVKPLTVTIGAGAGGGLVGARVARAVYRGLQATGEGGARRGPEGGGDP